MTRPAGAGLTLVELLVALGLLVVVSTATLLVFRSITQAWRRGQRHTERYQQARLLVDLFERELSSCAANPRFPLVGVPAAGGAPAPAEATSDALFFTATLPGRAGFIERGYWLDAAGVLRCHDEEPADGDYATGTLETCGTGVRGLHVRFYGGVEWTDRWDGRAGAAEAGRLPKAVAITLTVGERQPETFKTVIHVPTS